MVGRCLDHGIRVCHLERDGLLYKHMASGLQAINGNRGMEKVRRHNHRHIRLGFPEHLAVIFVKGAL
jgi:hypothetical protein